MRKFIITVILCIVLIDFSNIYAQDTYFKLTPLNKLKMAGIKRQTLDYSCGAAALSILLKDYFQDDREEYDILSDIVYRLSDEEKIERVSKGFSMLDLKKTSKRLGYFAEGVILPQTAVTAIVDPVIILLKKKNLNHFVVLKGITHGRAFIADPARGHLRMPLYELFSQWDGETLILGRLGFGLPKDHGLSLPQGNSVAPEREVVRTLQHTPAP